MSKRRDNVIDFGCPQCQARLRAVLAEDGLPEVGQRVRCPVCQLLARVPTAKQAAAWMATSGPNAEYALRDAAGTASLVPDSLTVTCPVCGTRITAAREQAGHKVSCPDCHTPVEVREPVESAPPKRAVRMIAPTEEYPVWGVGQPPPDVTAVYQTYIPVECSLCRTRMLATEAEVGRKLVCPDCGTATVVPPLARPASRLAATVVADVTEAGYAVRALAETAAGEPDPYASWFPIICPQCSTRLHAAPEQVGKEIACPDCETRFVIRAPAASRPKVNAPADGEAGYAVGAKDEPPPWKPIFTSAFAESEQDDRHDRASDAPATEPVRRRGLLQPSETVPPGLWRCTAGFLFMETVWPRWLVFSCSMIVSYWLLTLAASLTKVDSIITWVLSLGYSGIASMAAIVWLVVFCANMVIVVIETAAGSDSIEGWPDGPYQDWMPDASYVVNALVFSAIPGVVVKRLLTGDSMPGGPWLTVSIFLGFPIVLLSLFEWGSAIRPCSGAVLASLYRSWWAWGLFYAATAVLLSAATTLAVLALVELGGWGIVLAAPILVGMLLIYFRLLGRLGLACGRRLA
ncbi:MAG: hypothetical protein U1E05_02590 [Patescibacteria group bacterium]|nr:hypothetical protein [Patescibacteria group bacterium]